MKSNPAKYLLGKLENRRAISNSNASCAAIKQANTENVFNAFDRSSQRGLRRL